MKDKNWKGSKIKRKKTANENQKKIIKEKRIWKKEIKYSLYKRWQIIKFKSRKERNENIKWNIDKTRLNYKSRVHIQYKIKIIL